jgi:hypothetical protein
MREKGKTFPVSAFTLDETLKYFQELDSELEQSTIDEIYKITRGIPGRLAIVRRILGSSEPQVLLDEMPVKLSDLFEIEWRAVTQENENQVKILAIMAHDAKIHRTSELGELVGIAAEEVKLLLEPLGFIELDSETNEVGFVSESFRRFAEEQLRSYRGQVMDWIIDDLFKFRESENSMIYLPRYLSQEGRYDDLLEYLTPETFEKLVEHTQSLAPISSQAELGVKAARSLGRVGDLIRFSLQKSVIEDLNATEVLRSEVEACMALGKEVAALALAENAALAEDRLHLMSIIARIKKEKGEPQDFALLDRIRQLHEQVDTTMLGDRAVEIASDLIHSFPDLAIKMVENATRSSKKANSPDQAFASLFLSASDADLEEDQLAPTVDHLLQRIKDPKTRKLSAAASIYVRDYSAQRIISEVSKWESPTDQLYFLQQWTLKNREREDAADVVDFALRIALRSIEPTLTARDLRELATPLLFIQDTTKAKQLVGAFDSQMGAVQHLSTSVDYIRLHLILANAEARYDVESSGNRIIQIYLYNIGGITDLVLKAECLARLMASLKETDPKMLLEEKFGLHVSIKEDLRRCIDQLLAASAEHYRSTRGVIRALAKQYPELAREIAISLNTENRRDLALSDLLRSYCQIKPQIIDFAFVFQTLQAIVSKTKKDQILLSIMQRLEDSLSPLSLTQALPLFAQLKDIDDANDRCQALCLGFLVLRREETCIARNEMRQNAI